MLENYWYIACSSKSISKKPHAFKAFNKSLVAFRGTDGVVAVLEDRCAHRNAPLSKGFIDNGLLRCPYHGWGYRTDGVAADIPACPDQSAVMNGVTQTHRLRLLIITMRMFFRQ